MKRVPKHILIIFILLCLLLVLSLVASAFATFILADNRLVFFGTTSFVLVLSFSLLFLAGFIVTHLFSNRNLSTPKKFKSRIAGIILAVFFSFASVLIFYISIDRIKDIPFAFKSKYETLSGNMENVYLGSKGSKSFTINGILFETSVEDYDFYVEGKRCTVKFLPNSRFIISIKE